MMKRFPGSRSAIRCTLIAVLLTVLAGTSWAQSPDLKVNLVAKKVTSADGKEQLVSAEKARPGEIIQYEATYQNGGAGPLRNVGAVVPVPKGLAFVAESAQPSPAEASLDGKNFNAMPLTRKVKNAAGVMEDQAVPLSEYRALRWTLAELGPGNAATVVLRAQVESNGVKP